ncbi:hypothetical protein ACFX13_047365 [Malus domestica]
MSVSILRDKRRKLVLGTEHSQSPVQYVAEEIARAAFYTSHDNISVIVIDLRGLEGGLNRGLRMHDVDRSSIKRWTTM